MYFVEKAREFIAGPKPNDVSVDDFQRMRLTLDYLLDNAMGHENTVATWRIIEHLESNGQKIDTEIWQTDILGYLRENGVYIGSIIGGRGGIFMIVDAEDARAAHESYQNRIAAEERRLEMLEAAITDAGWTIH